MITSILCNAKPEDHFNFYIFDFGIKETDKKELSKLKKEKDFNLEYIKIPNHLLQKLHSLAEIFSTCGYIDESTYARMQDYSLLNYFLICNNAYI